MKLIVGLGNPGPEYIWSRHNAGWLVIDSFVKRLNLGTPRMRFSGAFWDAGKLEGERTLFLKPFTYMNLSGRSVAEAVRYNNLENSDILIIFDDVAIPFGRLRFRNSGSAGGQKGMISVISSLGSLDLARLRVGVGAPAPGVATPDWVLGQFYSHERKSWPDVEDAAWKSVKRWLAGEAGEGFTLDIAPTTGGNR